MGNRVSTNPLNTNASDIAQTGSGEQYGRVCTLLVTNTRGEGIDLSQLRIKFAVKRTDTATPNTANIRVYNLENETAILIRKNYTNQRVILQAGYATNYGVVFQGNIKQVILGRESATDTFIDIIAGDGNTAYNYSVVISSLAKGSTQNDQITACINSMSQKGVTQGYTAALPKNQLPRGKVLYGPAKNYLRNISQTTQTSWSIQNEKVTFIANKGYLPGTRVVLTAATGMVGTPNQTNEGVNVKCLLNPNIRVGGLIVIDNKSVALQALNLEQLAAASLANQNTANQVAAINNLTPRDLAADGTYYVLVLELTGDTRGVDWYCNLICLRTDVSTNPLNTVQLGAGSL